MHTVLRFEISDISNHYTNGIIRCYLKCVCFMSRQRNKSEDMTTHSDLLANVLAWQTQVFLYQHYLSLVFPVGTTFGTYRMST